MISMTHEYLNIFNNIYLLKHQTKVPLLQSFDTAFFILFMFQWVKSGFFDFSKSKLHFSSFYLYGIYLAYMMYRPEYCISKIGVPYVICNTFTFSQWGLTNQRQWNRTFIYKAEMVRIKNWAIGRNPAWKLKILTTSEVFWNISLSLCNFTNCHFFVCLIVFLTVKYIKTIKRKV